MDALLDLSESLAPTLDLNDRATLKESIHNLNQKLNNVTTSAGRQEAKLEEAANIWRDFQVSGILSMRRFSSASMTRASWRLSLGYAGQSP